MMILAKQHLATDAFMCFAETKKIVIYLLVESKFSENLFVKVKVKIFCESESTLPKF